MKIEKIQELLEIVKRLRAKDGCPWDRKQTHQSLANYLEEESWEVKDVIEQGLVKEELKEELADILLQVVMHSCIAEENKNFDFGEVVDYLGQKLIRRHPHVFDKENIKEGFDIEKEWDKIKVQEWGKKYHPLERVPLSSSLEHWFQKLMEFQKKDKSEVSLPQNKLQELEKEKEEQKKLSLVGEIFYLLALWCYSQGINWEQAFKKKLQLEKEEVVQKEKKLQDK